ncbi:MAG: hypothetical protein R3C05_14215 [Pirellulaceae bacterium]
MFQFVCRAMLVASLFVGLAGTNLAQASHIRSVVERRQHPHGPFFVKDSQSRMTTNRSAAYHGFEIGRSARPIIVWRSR